MKKEYIKPEMTGNNRVDLEKMMENTIGINPNASVTPENVEGKERDTYNYNYEEEAWGTISHSIW